MQVRRENLPLTSIRGVAAAWVVGLHVQPFWFPGAPAAVVSVIEMGHVAVDIFFVLSGFILAQVYGAIRFEQVPTFWLRRICRVYPLHLAVMATVPLAILMASALRGSAHPYDWISFGVVTLLMQSFLLDELPWSPPSWSVGVELLCYAIFPLTIRLIARMPGLLLAGLAVALALAEACVLQGYDAVGTGVGGVLRGLVGFHLGATLCVLLPHLPVRAAPSVALTGSVGIVGGIGASSPTMTVLAAAVAILALAPDRGFLARALSWGPLVWLGRVSFSIYLLHAQVQFVLNRTPSQFMAPWAMTALFVAILLPLSEVTYRFIEQPGRRLPAFLIRLRAKQRDAPQENNQPRAVTASSQQRVGISEIPNEAPGWQKLLDDPGDGFETIPAKSGIPAKPAFHQKS
jgi:peptidoglycan/LPS O-acetylase OafA/YrhL